MKLNILLPAATLLLIACNNGGHAREPQEHGATINDMVNEQMLLNLPHAFDAGWEGRETCELLFEDKSVRVGRCVFPPDIGHEKHYHKPHFGYVLEGGTLHIADSTGEHVVTTKTGSSWETTTVTVHEALNIGDTTTSYLIVELVNASVSRSHGQAVE